jgi:C-terminal processing protease CtpA/Prc
MWKGYDRWYGLFETHHINWDSVHDRFRPLVNNNMTPEELYEVLCNLIKPLNDPHVFLQPTSERLPRYESSVFFRENKVQRDFSINVIKDKYLLSLITVDDHLHYGILPENIGYLHFGEFGMPVSFYKMQLDKILDSLKNTRALIIDIRDHGGGDDEVSRYVAGRFAREPRLFMTTKKRNGPKHNNFTAAHAWYVQPEENAYTKPIILLTTRWTTSAGETFTWAMNTQQHVTQIGDTTAGGFTDLIARELPNGWLYFTGVGDYRDAEGNSKEGIGIAPVKTITNSRDDIQSAKDLVLEEAIRMLH